MLKNPINNYGHNKIFDINTTNINPVKINIDNKNIISSRSEQNQSFSISFKINKYLFFTILLFMVILGIVIIIMLTMRFNKGNDDLILEEQRKQNRTFQLDKSKVNFYI